MFPQAMHFLFALTLVPVCWLRTLHSLSPSGAKPPPVAVLQITEDDELQGTTGTHPTPSRGAFSFVDQPTRSPAGSKYTLTLRAFYCAHFALKARYSIPTMGASVRRYAAASEIRQGLEHRAALEEIRRAREAHQGAGGRELHLRV